jgi:hypothetical protein
MWRSIIECFLQDTGCIIPRANTNRRGPASSIDRLAIAGCSVLAWPTTKIKEATILSFVTACVAAVLLAVVGAVVLNHFQEPVSTAFATVGVRL